MVRGKKAFSIVELVVGIAILALIVAIMVPALAKAREAGRSTVSLSNLRQHGAVATNYLNEWEVFPFVTEVSDGYTHLEGGGVSKDAKFFGVYAAWPIGLLDAYYDGAAFSDVFHPPGGGAGPVSGYWYSANFISDPTFWDPAKRSYSLRQLRPTSMHEVAWPSSKGLFAERDSLLGMRREFERTTHGAIALVDGAAVKVSADQLTRPYSNGCDGYLGGLAFGLSVIHTIDGVRGRDVR